METEGLLESFDTLDAFVQLWRTKFTGALRFERESLIKIFYFHDGVIVAATSNDPPDQIGEILKKNGKITPEQLNQIQEAGSSRALGEGLISAGFITRKELLWALKMQLIEMVSSILKWTDGSYSLVENYLPKRTENVSFLTQHILLELILRSNDRDFVLGRIISPDDLLMKDPERKDDYKALDLSKDADAIVGRLEPNATVAEIAASSKIDDFSVFKLLGALKMLGILVPVGGGGAAPHAAVEPASTVSLEDALAGSSATELGLEPPSFDVSQPSPGQTEMSFDFAPAEAAAPASFELDLPPIPAKISAPAAESEHFESVPDPVSNPSASSFDLPPAPEMGATPDAAPGSAAETSLPSMPEWDPSTRASFAGGESGGTLDTSLEDTFEEMEPVVGVPSTSRIPGQRVDMNFPVGRHGGRVRSSERRKTIAFVVFVGIAFLAVAGAYQWRKRKRLPRFGPPVAAAGAAKSRSAAGAGVPATGTAASPSSVRSAASTAPATASSVAVPRSGETVAASPAVTASKAPPAPLPVAPPVSSPAVKPAPSSIAAKPVSSSIAAKPAVQAAPVKSAAPSPPPSPPAATADFRKMGQEFARKAAGYSKSSWTIQIELVCADESVERALGTQTAEFRIWFVPISYKGRSCYRIFAGVFASEAAARSALQRIPAHFLEGGNRPAAVSIVKALK